MRSELVVLPTPFINQDLRFQQRREDLPIEELVAHL